ncbi:MAG: lipocalin family protein [Plesiomonas sp.]
MLRPLSALMLSAIMSFSTPSYAELDQSLNAFDEPYIVGDWLWRANGGAEITLGEISYRSMSIRFDSRNRFLFVLQRSDGKNDVWQGKYDINSDALTLFPEGDTTQYLSFSLSQNQFVMGNIVFIKLPPSELLGSWQSAQISGTDVMPQVNHFAVNFHPDFQFESQSTGKDGKLQTNRGLYIYEGNEVVLFYEDGRQSLNISQENNELILNDNLFDSRIALVKR